MHIDINIKNDEDTKTIEIKGDLSIQYINELYNKLKNVTDDEYEHIKINLYEPENMDLSAIQMFIALKKTVKAQNKKLEFNIDINKDLKNLLENTGFGNLQQLLNN